VFGLWFVAVVMGNWMLFEGMLLLPGFAVVGSKGFYLIVLQVNKLVTIGYAAFGYVGAELTAKHTVQLAGG